MYANGQFVPKISEQINFNFVKVAVFLSRGNNSGEKISWRQGNANYLM